LFVPGHWSPPSVFDLAHRTGFDTESLILCFAIGGLATAGYRVLEPASEHVLAPQSSQFSPSSQLGLMIQCPRWGCVCFLFCHPFDLLAQPAGKSFFELHLRAGPVKVIYRHPSFNKGNEPARRTLPTKLRRHKLHQ
jgi:hypothetical protein